MRISDWSSDVCSSDLRGRGAAEVRGVLEARASRTRRHQGEGRGLLRAQVRRRTASLTRLVTGTFDAGSHAGVILSGFRHSAHRSLSRTGTLNRADTPRSPTHGPVAGLTHVTRAHSRCKPSKYRRVGKGKN